MIEAVLFDIGGVLLDVCTPRQAPEDAAARVGRALARAGLGHLAERLPARLAQGLASYEDARDVSLREATPEALWEDFVFPEVEGTPGAAILSALAEELSYIVERFGRVKSPVSGAHAVLSTLRIAGYRLGCISNTISTREAQESLHAHGFDAYFEVRVLSSEVQVRKPDPAIFHIALSQLNVHPRRAIYVGDTLSRDVAGAVRAGLGGSVFIRSGLTDEKDRGTEEVRPTHTISRLAELTPIVRSWRC